MAWYLDVIIYIWNLFTIWLSTIFVLPFQTMDMLWLLVPVWISWFFAEFFQEKTGTSMGNAISNSVIVLWGAIDCARQTVKLISEGMVAGFGNILLRFAIIAVIFGYGAAVVFLGIKGNALIKRIARIREVTYVFVMLVPIFYNAIPFSFEHILSAIVFFPLFYFAIEYIDRLTPNPKALVEDELEAKKS